MRPRLLFIFLDGVGLAPPGTDNPFASVPMPALTGQIGGRLVAGTVPRDGVLLRELDATLGVEGMPQSATGQTSLFTGGNAAAVLGFHQAAFPGGRLQRLLAEHSLFRRLSEEGLRCTFANPLTRDPYGQTSGRLSATTRAMMAAGLPFRRLSDLARDEAVTWDVCRDRWTRSGGGWERIEAPVAGRHLVGLAATHDVTLFETFMTDLAGHGRWGWTAEEALTRVDGLIAGILGSADPGLTVLLTSDHGNVESESTRLHTRNPVPLVVWGPGRDAFAECSSILHVAPAVPGLFGLAQEEASQSEASDLL
ncbi:MAG: metalloenzyme [Thermoanaerobaculia bacterium]